ncbi:MAG: hypothetical protein ACI8XU_000210 [Kiritimatiellia bacterium]
MGCVNHPNAPAAASCKKCSSELCGICTRFLNSGEYCEKCATLAEADAYLKSRDRNQEAREVASAKITTTRIDEEETRQKNRSKDGIYVKGGVAMGCLMVFVSLGLYAYPNLTKSDEQLAQEQSIVSLEHCRQVFVAIGIMLSEGQTPDASMSCPGTNIPNIVSRRGDRITVSHPNPRQFGLVELYVTSDSHRVVMEGQGQG